MKRMVPSVAAPALILQGVGWLALVAGLIVAMVLFVSHAELVAAGVGLVSVAYWALFVLMGRLAELVEFIAGALLDIRDGVSESDGGPDYEDDPNGEPTIDALLARVERGNVTRTRPPSRGR